jgi:hypothetical protein
MIANPHTTKNRHSIAGTVIRLMVGRSVSHGSIPLRTIYSPFHKKTSRTTPKPNQNLVQCLTVTLYQGKNRQWRESKHSTLSSEEFKNEWI